MRAKITSKLLTLLLLFSCALTQTSQADIKTSNNEIAIMGTSDGPPYMIQASQSGLDIDIPRAALKQAGIKLELEFYPLFRAIHELQAGRIELTAPFFTAAPHGVYVSDSHIEYRPSIITLNNIPKITKLSELSQYSIATFQGATGYFNDVFYTVSKESPDYLEHYEMKRLVTLLMSERYQVVVLDYWIFRHYLEQSKYSHLVNTLTFHEVLPRVPATVAFTDEKLRDRFNEGLKEIKKNGTYQSILDKYQRE